MLTKIGVATLLGTIGTAAVGGGTALANEPCNEGNQASQVVVTAPPIAQPVDYAYGNRNGFGYGNGYGTPGVYYRRDRREELERMRRERREEAMRHAMWLHRHGGFGRGRW